MKFIGKQIPLLHELIAQYPGLVIDPKNRSTVLDATFRMPDGRDAYSATSLAMVDYLLEVYPAEHPAKYFFFGIDEFSSDDLAKLADKLGMSPAQAFAHCVNLGTDHVLARGVTPLVWGDTMLSSSLGTEQHGLTLPGYQPDERMAAQPGGAYHAVFGKGTDCSLQTMVNFLRDRDKIIVVDWHYQPSLTGEFPSVDYFQRVGFKDVWGAPWHDATNIRQFARYAASRGAGGMIATAWFDAHAPESRLLLHLIIGTSAAYFRDPAIAPPTALPARFDIRGRQPRSRDDEKSAGWIARTDRSLEFVAPVTERIVPVDGRLLITAAGQRGRPLETSLSYDSAQHALRGTCTLPDSLSAAQYQVRYCYTDSATDYVYLKEDMQGFVVSDHAPKLPATSDATMLLTGEFSDLQPADLKSTIWLGGTCAGPLGWAKPRGKSAAPRPGGLDTEWFDRIWFLPSQHLNDAVCRAMQIHVEAKMTGDFASDSYCALLTKGDFHTGFRILVGQDRGLLFQLGGLDLESGGPLSVRTSRGAISLDHWSDIDVVYVPPANGNAGRMEIRIDGRRLAGRRVEKPMSVSTAVIGIGCEFGSPLKGPYGKRRPNFPGLIRTVTVRTLN